MANSEFMLTPERIDKIAASLLESGSPTVNVLCLPCPFCKVQSTVVMPTEAYVAFLRGSHTQDCWPEGTPDEREMLVTGTHGKCWDVIFDEDENYNEEEG